MLARLMIGILFLSLMGCESRTRSSNSNATPSQPTLPSLAPGEKPKAILDLPKPVESKQVNGRDVSEESPDVLQAAARQAIAAGRHADATILQYWACQQLDQEYYNLACYSALASKTDAAFYWLQQAGLTEGFDLEWAERDADLVRVRADPRWPTFVPWLGQCQAYWMSQAQPITTVVLPENYKVDDEQELTAIIWLHGMGSEPSGLVNPDEQDSLAQSLANELNIAWIGVSGTLPKGTRSFVWAENAEQDLARIQAALKEVEADVKIRQGGLIAFGFSQGAQTGLELAVRHPELFAGAIVLSPGSQSQNLNQIAMPNPLLKQRGFVFGCGAGEHPGNRAQTRDGANWVEQAGAKVELQFFAGQSAHTFPDAIPTLIPKWVKFIQNANAESGR